jgi:hypothetical protein
MDTRRRLAEAGARLEGGFEGERVRSLGGHPVARELSLARLNELTLAHPEPSLGNARNSCAWSRGEDETGVEMAPGLRPRASDAC